MKRPDRKPELGRGGGRWGRGGTRDGRGEGPIVGVAERRGPEKEMNPELGLKLTLKRQAQEENQCRRIMKGQRWGWREVRKNHCPRSQGKSVVRGSTGDHVKCHTEVTF